MIYFIWSLKYGPWRRPIPWGATGLEWKTPSPPPLHNFDETPIVTHEAYDYSTVIERGDGSWLANAHAHVETLALREQFDTAEQQKDASTLGMWIFLITEVMFFGGLFWLTRFTATLTRSCSGWPAPRSTSVIGAPTRRCCCAAASPWCWRCARRSWGSARPDDRPGF
jgi:hypothetical protein